MAASRSKSMSSVHQRRGAPSHGQPKWWRAGRGADPPWKRQSDVWCVWRREQRIVLSPRTGLNGGERGQEQVREAKKQKEEIENPSQDQPKWWRSGSVNLFGPYLCLCPCLYGHLCPCPYSCLSYLFSGPLPVLIVTWGEGLAFTGPGSKPAYTVRGGGAGKDGAAVEALVVQWNSKV